MRNFDFAFLGCLFPREIENEITINTKGAMQNAANSLQWKIIDGLEKNLNRPVKIINSICVGSYPKRYRKARIKELKFSHVDDSQDISVGYLNIPILKERFQTIALIKQLKKWTRGVDEDRQKVLFVYGMLTHNMKVIYYVKQHLPTIKICLIVPDLPIYMNQGNNGLLFSLLEKSRIKFYDKVVDKIDFYVLLTKQMKDKFPDGIKYTVVEGIAPYCDETSLNRATTYPKTMVYTGMIEERYGVLDMVNSFMQIDSPDWSLEIYGNGSSFSELSRIAKSDDRVHVHGQVSSDIARQAQKNATLLINPRNNNSEYTKYSFPSKIMEYMSTGVPVLAYKLDGMPEEYIDYFFVIDDEPSGMIDVMKKVMNLSDAELDEMGKKAVEFVKSKKNPKIQCEKILSMIEKDNIKD